MWFFEAVSHVITAVMSIILILTELSLFRGWFQRHWPTLSHSHGFVTLAAAMFVISITLLGDLNSDVTSQEALGLPFWQVVMAAGILMFILAFVNLFASFIFRDAPQGITARQVRAQGAVAVHKTPVHKSSFGGSSHESEFHSPSAPELAQIYLAQDRTPKTHKSGAIGNAFRILTGGEKRDSSSVLPSYQTAAAASTPPKEHYLGIYSADESPASKYSRGTACTKKKVLSGFMGRGGAGRASRLGPQLPINVSPSDHHPPMEITAPLNVNPQFAHLIQRPDSAMHPSRTGDTNPYRWPAKF